MAFGAPVEPPHGFHLLTHASCRLQSLDSPWQHQPQSPAFRRSLYKVVPCTKRALTARQMQRLYDADSDAELTVAQKRVLAYFLLMFLLRGMPSSTWPICASAMSRRSPVYCGHKTGRQITLRIPREALRLIYAYRTIIPHLPICFLSCIPMPEGAVGTEGIIAYTSRLCGVSTGVCVCLPGGFFRASKSARTRRGIPGPRLPSIAVCSSVLSAKHWGTPPCG